MRLLVDTNVLLRLSQPRHAFHSFASRMVEETLKSGHEIRLVPQILYEYWVVATRDVAENGLGFSIDETTQLLTKFKGTFPVLRDERRILERWEKLVRDYEVRGKPAHDARIVAAMKRHGITHIVTFDADDFRRYEDITVLDPQAGHSLPK